jgi:carboxymethylenebutenolidase
MVTHRHDAVDRQDDGSMALDVWSPDAGRGPGLLLIQEVYGVGPYISAVAERLAETGYVVAAPDVFWRFHPGWVGEHTPEGTEASIAKVKQLDFALAVGDCVAALDHLGALDEVTGRPGVIGFCLGGTLGFRVAVADEPAAAVCYYGSGIPSMIDDLGAVGCPMLLHFGADDPYIPAASIEPLAEALVDHPGIVLNVEIAGHAFDNHEAPMFYSEAAARAAWAKTMAFLGEHLPV